MTMRRAVIEVTYDDHGEGPEDDWAYSLRMGVTDADDVIVQSDEEVSA